MRRPGSIRYEAYALDILIRSASRKPDQEQINKINAIMCNTWLRRTLPPNQHLDKLESFSLYHHSIYCISRRPMDAFIYLNNLNIYLIKRK